MLCSVVGTGNTVVKANLYDVSPCGDYSLVCLESGLADKRQFVVTVQVEEVQERKEHMGGKLNLDCRETHIYNLY